MATFQASSTIEHLSTEKIAHEDFFNKIVFMNLFATSTVAFWY